MKKMKFFPEIQKKIMTFFVKTTYLRYIVFFKLKNCRKTSLFFWISGKYLIFLIFDLSDIWVNRIQKLGGCVFFSINFGSLKGCGKS